MLSGPQQPAGLPGHGCKLETGFDASAGSPDDSLESRAVRPRLRRKLDGRDATLAVRVARVARPHQPQPDPFARRRQQAVDLVDAAERIAVDGEQHVALPDARPRRGPGRHDVDRLHGGRRVEQVRPLEEARDGEELAAEPEEGAADMSVGEQLRDDPLRRGRRHREGQVLRALDDCGVDADDARRRVDERAARVARVERHVGLHYVLDEPAVLCAERAPLGGDDAGGDGRREPERVADGHHELPHPQRLRVTERGKRH
mmetsp:Transcript_35585/g.105505  ORF Transcript_35585/g.105505 Transcript_35585/m.105505 type:complete len:259 (+) Transcript_35585:59-835(+)